MTKKNALQNDSSKIKTIILKVLEEKKEPMSYDDVYRSIVKENLYNFNSKTPQTTVSTILGNFIRDNDTRVKRVKKDGKFYYYLTKYEDQIDFEQNEVKSKNSSKEKFKEGDLHTLLATYLDSYKKNIIMKTIDHTKAKKKNKNNNWLFPDAVGVQFEEPRTESTKLLLKTISPRDMLKIYSFEIKISINTDAELKNAYFQAVSNSSWANYGYLVVFDISPNLQEEMERLNEAFGIGVIELNARAFESKFLLPSKFRKLDFKTIDKLCEVHPDFAALMDKIKKYLNANKDYIETSKKEILTFRDKILKTDEEIEKYCKSKHIPFEVS